MILRIILFVILGFQVVLNMTRPLITLYSTNMGADTQQVGFLVAVYAVLPLIFSIHAGKIADRIGDRIPVILGSFGTAVGVLIPALFPSIPALYASQIIVGLSHVFLVISLQNVLGHVATRENRDHYFSMFSMFVAIGGFIGPVLGGYLADHASFSTAFRYASFIGVLPILFSFFIPNVRKQSQGKQEMKLGASLSLLKKVSLRKALLSSALVLYSRDIFVAYFPLLGEEVGLTISEIGWIIAIQGLSMAAVRLFLTSLTRRMGRGQVLFGSIILAGISFALMPVVDHFFAYCLLSAAMGLGLGCGQPLSMTTTYNASPKNRTGEILGLRLASNRLSQLIAPVVFGLIGSSAGLLSVFVVSGVVLMGGAFLTKEPDSVSDPM
ncbi:MFS transporter [Paenibacillus sp. Marseille-Q4541]|uniref:MFS transporter n=1 Tax=Paenibacillus sp. Marseille-Q4541 TaxID=2831522 RepID=UPI001BA840E2|nr:MFS transporter [Paenibacillus sp. Marseille-Q4541]